MGGWGLPPTPSHVFYTKADPCATPYTLLYIWMTPFAVPKRMPSVPAGMAGTRGDATRGRAPLSVGLRTYLAPGLWASGPAGVSRCLGVLIGSALFFTRPCGRANACPGTGTQEVPDAASSLISRGSVSSPVMFLSVYGVVNLGPLQGRPVAVEGGAGSSCHL